MDTFLGPDPVNSPRVTESMFLTKQNKKSLKEMKNDNVINVKVEKAFVVDEEISCWKAFSYFQRPM